jgi:hypothetical protein
MRCASRSVPRVVTTSAWVSPRVNKAEPWVRGKHAVADFDGAHGARVAAVNTRLAGQNLATHNSGFDFKQQAFNGLTVKRHPFSLQAAMTSA